ncbi:hypothetical protein ATANTOWER_013962, partial [Ataeniobius toweri]|nr:hypothetical protein [Ataeniobius toweri]
MRLSSSVTWATVVQVVGVRPATGGLPVLTPAPSFSVVVFLGSTQQEELHPLQITTQTLGILKQLSFREKCRDSTDKPTLA